MFCSFLKTHIIFRTTLEHHRLLDFNSGDQQTLNSSPVSFRSDVLRAIRKYDAFAARTATEMQTADLTAEFPYRKKKSRYHEVQKCMERRSPGGKFDYDVYMTCVGCRTCDTKAEKREKKRIRKVMKIKEKMRILRIQMRAISMLNGDAYNFNTHV